MEAARGVGPRSGAGLCFVGFEDGSLLVLLGVLDLGIPVWLLLGFGVMLWVEVIEVVDCWWWPEMYLV